MEVDYQDFFIHKVVVASCLNKFAVRMQISSCMKYDFLRLDAS